MQKEDAGPGIQGAGLQHLLITTQSYTCPSAEIPVTSLEGSRALWLSVWAKCILPHQ